MADIEQFYGEIRRAVKACPEATLQDAIVRAARTFCQETWYVRRAISFNTVANQQQYVLIPPANEEVFNVKHGQITQVNGSIIPLRFPYGTTVNPNIGPQMPWQCEYIPDGIVQLTPAADQVYPVTVEAITQPVQNSNQIPDILANKWDRALGYGALEWILRMAGDPWYDSAGSATYMTLFNQEINKAKRQAMYDFTPGPHAWMQRGFAYSTGARRY